MVAARSDPGGIAATLMANVPIVWPAGTSTVPGATIAVAPSLLATLTAAPPAPAGESSATVAVTCCELAASAGTPLRLLSFGGGGGAGALSRWITDPVASTAYRLFAA